MDPQAFDSLSREFANGVPRRTVLKTLAAACFYGVFRPVLGVRTANAAQACVAADITACINTANDKLALALEDCNEVPHPVQCRAAAQKRHDAAVKACNPCPQRLTVRIKRLLPK